MTSFDAKEAATKSIRSLAFIAGCALALGCRESRLVMSPNATPVAVARAVGPDGKLDTGEVRFDYSGEDVEVTLDGTQSSDSDGKVTKYIWLSGTPVPADGGVGNLSHEDPLPDGGTKFVNAGGRVVPDGQDENWPADVKKPTVKLGVGKWTFVLWVEDDRGGISDPSDVTVSVGQADPVQVCVDSALPLVSEACLRCACGQSATCAAALPMDKCDANCWGLIQCATTTCSSGDLTCIGAMCAQYISAASAAQAAGACLMACLSECAPSMSTGH